METFVSAHPELADADRQMLLGWRDVVEGVFEIRERDGEAIIAVNLIDELTYRARRGSPPRPGRLPAVRRRGMSRTIVKPESSPR